MITYDDRGNTLLYSELLDRLTKPFGIYYYLSHTSPLHISDGDEYTFSIDKVPPAIDRYPIPLVDVEVDTAHAAYRAGLLIVQLIHANYSFLQVDPSVVTVTGMPQRYTPSMGGLLVSRRRPQPTLETVKVLLNQCLGAYFVD